jgi:hypothetical protein
VRIALVALLCLIGAGAFAADLLSGIEALVVHERMTRGQFVQIKHLSGIDRPLRGTGTFIVDRDRGVLWRSEAPFRSALRITRGEIVQKSGDEVLMHLSASQEPAVASVSSVLFATFAADLSTLARSFSFDGEITGPNWRLVMKPREASLARVIRELELHGDRYLRVVELTGASGDVLHIEFQATETSAAPTAAEAAEFE